MNRRRLTRSEGDEGRAQTLHDYVAGISVFVLTVALVLGLLPTVVAPFQSDGEAVTATQATRVAGQVVGNLSVESVPNTLSAENFSALLATNATELRDRYGLPEGRYVNLTVTALNGSQILTNATGTPATAGATAANEEASDAARVIRVNADGWDCIPGCRLLVRVW